MEDTFELTEDHIKLIRNMYIYFDDIDYDGAPAVDIKKPYGNSGCQSYQVYEILFEKEWDSDECMPEELRLDLMKLHKETGIALQIFALNAEIKPGKFQKTRRYSSLSWKAADI